MYYGTSNEGAAAHLNFNKLKEGNEFLDFEVGNWIADDGSQKTPRNSGPQNVNDFNKPYWRVKGVLETKDVKQLYRVGKEIGAGKYGIVRIVEKANYSKMRFAMKSIPVEEGFEELTQREFDILCKIDHPFLMDLVEIYYSD